MEIPQMNSINEAVNDLVNANGTALRPARRKLNIGVVGIGRMGQQHALNLLQLSPRATLICACSPAETDLKWADEHLIPHGVAVFRTFEEMVMYPGLQAVIIASATKLQYQHTLECLKHGIHVLCEKPIATSSEDVSISTFPPCNFFGLTG